MGDKETPADQPADKSAERQPPTVDVDVNTGNGDAAGTNDQGANTPDPRDDQTPA